MADLVPRRRRQPQNRLQPFPPERRLTRTYWLHLDAAHPEYIKVVSEPSLAPMGFAVTVLRWTGAPLSRPEAGPIQVTVECTTLARDWIEVDEERVPSQWRTFLNTGDPTALPPPKRQLPTEQS